MQFETSKTRNTNPACGKNHENKIPIVCGKLQIYTSKLHGSLLRYLKTKLGFLQKNLLFFITVHSQILSKLHDISTNFSYLGN